MTPTLERYTRDQKLEQNAIARAIALNQSIPDPLENYGMSLEPRQDAPDPQSANMVLAHLKMVEHAMRANREFKLALKLEERALTESGHTKHQTLAAARDWTAKALVNDLLARGGESRFKQLSREIEKTRKLGSGRASRGQTYWFETDGFRMYFDFLLLWSVDGTVLEIGNAREISTRAGQEFDPQAWRNLENWCNEFEQSQRKGRPLENTQNLIWRDTGDRLRPRETIERTYPYIIKALHAITCTIRLER